MSSTTQQPKHAASHHTPTATNPTASSPSKATPQASKPQAKPQATSTTHTTTTPAKPSSKPKPANSLPSAADPQAKPPVNSQPAKSAGECVFVAFLRVCASNADHVHCSCSHCLPHTVFVLTPSADQRVHTTHNMHTHIQLPRPSSPLPKTPHSLTQLNPNPFCTKWTLQSPNQNNPNHHKHLLLCPRNLNRPQRSRVGGVQERLAGEINVNVQMGVCTEHNTHIGLIACMHRWVSIQNATRKTQHANMHSAHSTHTCPTLMYTQTHATHTHTHTQHITSQDGRVDG